MALNKGKHNIEEINGVLCTLVEDGLAKERLEFLKKLMEHNGYTTQISEQEDGTFRLGVTDLMFNPVIDIYKRRLKSLSNHIITPAYWLQHSDKETEAEVNYWTFKG